MSYTGKNPEFDGITLPEVDATPSTPESGKTKLYVKNGKIYILASDGTETEVGASGSDLFLTYFYG